MSANIQDACHSTRDIAIYIVANFWKIGVNFSKIRLKSYVIQYVENDYTINNFCKRK